MMMDKTFLVATLKVVLLSIFAAYFLISLFAFESLMYHKPTGLILLASGGIVVLLLHLLTEPWKQENYIRRLIIWGIICIVFYTSLRVGSKYYFDAKYLQVKQELDKDQGR